MVIDDASERIKSAALGQFAEVGYGSTKVDEIARAAGVGVASLYRRWPDKAALANELVGDYLDAFDALLDGIDGGTGEEKFLSLWVRLWTSAELDRELLLFVEAQVHAGFMTDEVAARKEQAGERWMATVSEFGLQADAATATAMMLGTLTAVWQQELPVDRDDLGARLWTALTL